MLVTFVKSLIQVNTTTRIYIDLYPLVHSYSPFLKGKPRDLQWRKVQIQRLYDLIYENEDRLVQAMKLDMNKPLNEAVGGDIAPVLDECLFFLKVREKI